MKMSILLIGSDPKSMPPGGLIAGYAPRHSKTELCGLSKSGRSRQWSNPGPQATGAPLVVPENTEEV